MTLAEGACCEKAIGVAALALGRAGVTPGRHRVSVEAEGETGGCTIGYLGIWIGTLRVIGRQCAACRRQ